MQLSLLPAQIVPVCAEIFPAEFVAASCRNSSSDWAAPLRTGAKAGLMVSPGPGPGRVSLAVTVTCLVACLVVWFRSLVRAGGPPPL